MPEGRRDGAQTSRSPPAHHRRDPTDRLNAGVIDDHRFETSDEDYVRDGIDALQHQGLQILTKANQALFGHTELATETIDDASAENCFAERRVVQPRGMRLTASACPSRALRKLSIASACSASTSVCLFSASTCRAAWS